MRRSEQTKQILRELNINERINFPYYLDKIDDNSTTIEQMKSLVQEIAYNQRIIEHKLDMIIDMISKKQRW